MDIVFNLDDITVGDVEELEEACGIGFETMNFTRPSAKLLTAMVYVSGRKQDPAFTMEDARKVKFSELTINVNPTNAAGTS